MKERDNVLRILKETVKSVKDNDTAALLDLSNQTINTASYTKDPDNIAVAVVVYSLSKILERDSYRSLSGWKSFYNTILASLDHSIKDIQNKDDAGFRKHFELINKAINKLSGKLKKYIDAVFLNAKISKASRIYEHGISAEQTAKLLGITMFELQNYTGQTGIGDVKLGKTMDAKSRVKLAMEMFR